MTVKLSELIRCLEEWAPPAYAESYDNVGLLTGDPNQAVLGAIVNLDITESVVDEALASGVNLIIAHHPIWFRAKKRLVPEDYVSRVIIKAIKHDIALYAAHTNLDNIQTGVNAMIAQKLGLKDLQLLKPNPQNPEIGSGCLGLLPEPLAKSDFLTQVKQTFNSQGIRYADFPGAYIQKVAVCGGAGSFLIPEARKQEVDAFITADISYHYFFDNEGKFLLMDIGHYESEQFTSVLITEYISNIFPKFAVHLSQVRTNPVQYH